MHNTEDFFFFLANPSLSFASASLLLSPFAHILFSFILPFSLHPFDIYIFFSLSPFPLFLSSISMSTVYASLSVRPHFYPLLSPHGARGWSPTPAATSCLRAFVPLYSCNAAMMSRFVFQARCTFMTDIRTLLGTGEGREMGLSDFRAVGSPGKGP